MYRRTGDVRSVQEKHGPDAKFSEQEELIATVLGQTRYLPKGFKMPQAPG